MVATALDYHDPRYDAGPGKGYDGVVRIYKDGALAGSGVLLYDGRTILTAGHVIDTASIRPDKISTGADPTSRYEVVFETPSGVKKINATGYLIHPGFVHKSLANDLALLFLPHEAPADATRYDLYRSSDELGKQFTFVGYGTPGTGQMGMDLSSVGIEPLRRLKAMNVFDALGEEVAGKETRWPGVDQKNWLYADFDSGNPSNDLFGSLLGRKDLGLGADEGLPTNGDSGGPAFIGNKIVGITIARGEIFGQGTDVNTRADSSFGESAVFMRVSSYASWIDEAMRHPVNNILPQSPVPQTKSAVASSGVHENGNAQMVFQIPNGGHVDILGTTQAVNLDQSKQYFDYLLELAIPQSTPDPVLLDVRDGIYRSLVTANDALKAQGKTDAFAELLVLNGAHGQYRILGSSKTDHFAILSGDASNTIVTSAVEAVTALGAGHFKTETPAIIAGDNSDQVIEGSAGNDILAGGGGTDTLIGGGGADTFVFNKRGNYRIEDFGRDDKLAFYFNSIKSLQDLASHVTYVTELNNGFTIGFDNTMTITVVGINFKDLTPDMVQFHV